MHQLPSATVRLLSSSQVITSVVSVVKELAENALDANATNLDIKLENFGFDKIEVRDNGDGIKAADTPVMAVRHYTSKINTHEDLESLETYGFRGEALGSVCSVAEVHITTKTAAEDISTQYMLDSSGHITSQRPSHLGQGTTVTVLKLFKNLPVRKQFYSTTKKCKEEIRKIQDLLMAYGIIKPELRIVFVHNKAVIWQKSKVSDHKMAFMSVLGTAIMSSMVPFQHQCDDPQMFISGYLPKPDADRTLTGLSTSDRSFLFINRRPVQHKEIIKMIRMYYNQSQNKDSSRCYPVFFMSIDLPASCLDVNLTPDKTQVMLQDKESVLLAIENVLKSVYHCPETDKVDMPSEVINDTALADIELGKNIFAGNLNPKQDDLCFSVDLINEEEKQREVCLKNQLLHCDETPDLDTRAVSATSQSNSIFQDNTIESPSDTINQNDFSISFTIGDNILMDTQLNSQFDQQHVGQTVEREILKDTNLSNELDDNWSKGTALKNSKGENLEPVKILCPEVESCVGENPGESNVDTSSQHMIKKPTNVIIEKSGFITAYDLISNKVVKKPLSAIKHFTQEQRARLLDDNPKASIEDISSQAEQLWEQLNEEEKLRYEDKAAKDLQRYKTQSAKVIEQSIQKPRETEKHQKLASGQSTAQKVKLKAPFSNQQILDKLFASQLKKKKTTPPIQTIEIPFSLSALKHQHCKLSEKNITDAEEFSLISKLNFPGAWVVATERKIELFNPYRIEEALLFKRLVENHNLSADDLESPIILTDRLLGGPQYLDILLGMQKDSPKPNGDVYFSDVRLTANGFCIKMIPGKLPVDNRIEIEGISNSLPFYGISDLKEILHSVMNKNSKLLSDCRPLTVLNYLEGEAVRLTRQLPLHLTKEDVSDTLLRMKEQLGGEKRTCIHGRQFFHHLADVPETG
ncbi:PMS1 protein homolog 1 [Pelodytes ibericus]